MFSVECLNKTGNVRINVILRPVGVTVFARAKLLSITCPHCVSIAFTYPACKARASHCIVTCDLSGGPYSSTLSHKRHDFRKNF